MVRKEYGVERWVDGKEWMFPDECRRYWPVVGWYRRRDSAAGIHGPVDGQVREYWKSRRRNRSRCNAYLVEVELDVLTLMEVEAEAVVLSGMKKGKASGPEFAGAQALSIRSSSQW